MVFLQVEEWVDKVHNHLEKESDSLKPSNDNAPSIHSVAIVSGDNHLAPQPSSIEDNDKAVRQPLGRISSEDHAKTNITVKPAIHTSNEDNISNNIEQFTHASNEDNINSNIYPQPATHSSNEDNFKNSSVLFDSSAVELEEKVLNIDLSNSDEDILPKETEPNIKLGSEAEAKMDPTENDLIIPPPLPPLSNSFEDNDSLGGVELPPPPEFSTEDSGATDTVEEPVDLATDTILQTDQLASDDRQRTEVSVEADRSDLSMISDREFEMMEREILEEERLRAKIASQELLVNQNSDFPFEDLGDSIKDDICSTTSEKQTSASDSTQLSEDKDFVKNRISDDTSDKRTSRSSDVTGEGSYISNFSSQSTSPVPSDFAYRTNIERLTSLDKLQTWDDGLEESLKRTSQFLIAAETTNSQASGGYDSSLERSLELGSFDDDSSDIHSPAASTPTKPTSVKSSSSTSKIMKPSGLAMPSSRLVSPSSKLRKSASSHDHNSK